MIAAAFFKRAIHRYNIVLQHIGFGKPYAIVLSPLFFVVDFVLSVAFVVSNKSRIVLT
tara:strand:- start:17952 stop:18125 length:174 start_codon:yes stop_codon:yes gene_type:complete